MASNSYIFHRCSPIAPLELGLLVEICWSVLSFISLALPCTRPCNTFPFLICSFNLLAPVPGYWLSTPDSRLLLDYWWHDKQGTISARLPRKKFENHFSFGSIVFVCALTSFCNHARHKSNLIVLLPHTATAAHRYKCENTRMSCLSARRRILNFCSFVRSIPLPRNF